MEAENVYSVQIFFSYAHEDKNWLDDLEKHLKGSRHASHWRDDSILPGAKWSDEIDANLNSADIILLLISPDFKTSRYCIEVEMKRALERHLAGEAEVIPILLRSTHWEDAPYENLQMLPRDTNGVKKALSLLDDRDDACANVAASIYRTITQVIAKKERLNKYKNDGEVAMTNEKFQEAQAAYKSALILAPNDIFLQEQLGRAYMRLSKYKDALASYEKALSLDGNNVQLWRNKSNALLALEDRNGAHLALLEAIKRDTRNAFLYKEDGDILTQLERWSEALDAYDTSIHINGNNDFTYDARAELRTQMATQLLDLASKDREKAKTLDSQQKNG